MPKRSGNPGPKIAVNQTMDAAARTDDTAPTLSAEEAVERRIDGLRRWLSENAPECFDEQLHVVKGTPERAYWHYGYMVALRDLRALLFDRPDAQN